MTSQSVLPSTNSRTMPTFSSEPRKAVMFLWRVTVVYTRSSARNWVVTSLALDCISPLISSWTTFGFLTCRCYLTDNDQGYTPAFSLLRCGIYVSQEHIHYNIKLK